MHSPIAAQKSRLVRSCTLLTALAIGAGLSAALAAPPNRAKAVELVRQAAIAFQQANLTRTINLCRQATLADPSYPRSYTWLGAAFQRQGNRDSACSAFRRAVQLAPKGPDADRSRRGMRELGCDTGTPVAITPEARWSEMNGNNGLAFSQDGASLVGAGRDGTWRQWSMPLGSLKQLQRGDSFELSGVTVSSSTSAAASASGTIRIYDLRDGRELNTFNLRVPINALDASPDGRFLAAGVSDGIRILDAGSGAQRDVFRTDNSPVYAVAYSPQGDKIAAGAGNDVRVYDANSGQLLRSWAAGLLAVKAVAWSGSGNLVAAGTGYNIRTFNVSTGRQERELRGHRLAVTTLAFGNGSLLASGAYDGQIRFWDAASGASRGAFTAHTSPVGGLAFAPGNHRLASADHNGSVCLWRVP